ncbi:MAG TPA: general secretion pathway protein GspK [Gammaproteobacteria bacterium]|nr:general secretion pathway protein GspK [Gammaproteobacteria bacterium]
MCNRKLNIPGKQKGVALITAVLVVALVTVLAVNMISRQQIDIRRTSNILNTETAYMYALGVESWGIGILLRDRENNQVDALGEDWAMTIPPIDVDGGQVVGRIEDMQSRFNLNSLLKKNDDGNEELSEPDYKIFRRLLSALDLDPDIADKVVDWIDKNSDVDKSGAEDYDYLGAEPAYRTANTKMVSPSELRLISGIDTETYKTLAPFVTTLPERTPININTALAPVIQALGENIEQSDAESFVESRPEDGYSDTDSFQNDVSASNIDLSTLSVNSNYFILFGESHFGRGRQLLTTLVYRPDTGKAAVIMRGQGAY